MRDFEDNLEAKRLYKLNTTYHGSGLFTGFIYFMIQQYFFTINKQNRDGGGEVKRT